MTWAFAMWQISIIMAPGYNFLIRMIPATTFNIGSMTLSITEESAPGVILFIAFSLLEVFVYLCYFNMAIEFRNYAEINASTTSLAAVDVLELENKVQQSAESLPSNKHRKEADVVHADMKLYKKGTINLSIKYITGMYSMMTILSFLSVL
jgi:hypothetical protein